MFSARSDSQVKIAPSILSADFSRLGSQVQEAEQAGADWVHVDVMDGHFVPNITIGPLVVKALRPVTSLPLDVHLMIASPERYIEAFGQAGAGNITVHVETCPHLHRTLQQIRETGSGVGVTLNPATPLSMIEPILDQVDLVLIMSVNPGFGGQRLIPQALDKVRRLRAMIEDLDCPPVIEIDGGVNRSTIGDVVAAGADVLVMGSAIFGAAEGIGPALQALRELATKNRSA